MVDRQDKEDSPALLTRVTRRQATRSDASILNVRQQQQQQQQQEAVVTPAAAIIKRPLKVTSQSETPYQIEHSKKLKRAEETLPQSIVAKSHDKNAVAKSLPTREVYEAQRIGRNPYFCIPCEKSFTRTSIGTHVRSKHKGKNTKVSCLFCNKKFPNHSKAQDHVAAEHKVYACNKDNCAETFSEFERLKGHLKSAHGKAEWPWICGFCDQILFFDLEFQTHIKKHTEAGPYLCPLCDATFLDTQKVTEHLTERHLPNVEGEKVEPEKKKQETSKRTEIQKEEAAKEPLHPQQQQPIQQPLHPQQQQPLQQPLLEAVARIRQGSGGFVTDKSESSDKMKDENAVNREIAALLLNLHASRGAPKAEDLSVKTPPAVSNDSAMDLTKSKTSAATITKLVKSSHATSGDLSGGKNSKTSNPASANTAAAITQNIPNFTLPTAPTNYPFYSSLATMASMTPSLAINSNYLLQNLLLGKMQQIVSASSGSTAAVTTKTSASTIATLSVPATSLPTQPLPAQSLTMQPTNVSLKPPAAVLKTTVPNAGANQSFTNPMTLTSGVGGETTTTTVTAATAASIPLLCGQIVSQLNGLLFLVHGISNASLEINLQTQLTAIHTRLQDIVTMVEHAKKSDPELNGGDKTAKEKQKDEEKIVAKHIQDYQRALLKQHDDKNGKNLVVDLPEASPNDSMELQEAESTSGYLSAAARRRRGRPPKNSNLDLSYSPPEKQMKTSINGENGGGDHSGHQQNGGDIHNIVANGNSHQQQQHLNGTGSGIPGAATTGSKSSKGIRNRVFCGECVGCLKNDDCGKCRYCKDKTKFGGQNRLRQKCLHRRCQMDTHRRRSSHNGQGGSANANLANAGNVDHNDSYESPTNDIYSGVDLARLAAVGQQQQQLAAVALAAAAAKQTVGLDLERDFHGENHHFDLKNGFPVDHHRSGSSASNGSDEDCDDIKTGKSQSRIDKWKAKHEAMLKLAQKTDKANEGEGKMTPDKNEDMLNLDPASGVCIEFDRKDVARKMSNGRHSMPPTSAQQQHQVLTV